MYSNQSKSTLIQLLKEIIKGEQELEGLKQALLKNVTQNGISLNNCFLHISFERPTIDNKNLQIFLDSHQIRYEQQELERLNLRSYQSFLDLILPNNQMLLKQLNQKDIVYTVPFPETINLIVNIFQMHLQIIRKLVAHLDTLLLRFDKQNLLVFLTPNKLPNQPIFIQLLKQLELQLSFDDILCLLRRLDIDLDSDIKKADWEYWINKRSTQKSRRNSASTNQIKSLHQSKLQYPTPINQTIQIIDQRQKTYEDTYDKENDYKQSNLTVKKAPFKFVKNKTQLVVDEFRLHLLNVGRYIQQIEQQRFELSSRADFSIHNIFQFFDLNLDGQVDNQDLKISLFQLGVVLSDLQINYFIYFFSNHDAYLVQQQFPQIFDDSYKQVQQFSKFTSETKRILRQLMQNYFDLFDYRFKYIKSITQREQKEIFMYLSEHVGQEVINLQNLTNIGFTIWQIKAFEFFLRIDNMDQEIFMEYFK
ncbi:hypothetical protein pb186bvf_005512 [Paramecium bursaria]